MTFYPSERIAIFVDGANLYSAAKALNYDLDFKKLIEEFRQKGRLIRAYYYTAIVEGEEYSPIRPLVDWLDYNGFTMVTKPVKRYTDATGHTRTKGNMDVEIAVDMLQLAPHMDHAVLFSGDGDFRKLVQALQSKGVRVTVVSTLKTQPPQIADELRRAADNFIDLAELMNSFGRPRSSAAGVNKPIPVVIPDQLEPSKT
ncbi:MAG: NYN domain-containing protein [Brevundimonas sp.]|uniref:LabA-like NYN domain-containing protein n=1 Tax=Brevundimonas sp. TaxID=1871086 RepID=UPI0039198A5A